MPDIKGFLTELSALTRKYGIEIASCGGYSDVRLDATTGQQLGWCLEWNRNGAYQVETDKGVIAGVNYPGLKSKLTENPVHQVDMMSTSKVTDELLVTKANGRQLRLCGTRVIPDVKKPELVDGVSQLGEWQLTLCEVDAATARRVPLLGLAPVHVRWTGPKGRAVEGQMLLYAWPREKGGDIILVGTGPPVVNGKAWGQFGPRIDFL